jgi:cytochrome c553
MKRALQNIITQMNHYKRVTSNTFKINNYNEMKNRLLLLLTVFFLLFSCKKSIQPEIYIEHIEKGNNISALAQAALLTNVAAAIQTGGPAYAVEFCNLKASVITDSLNNVFNCTISRISAKNRNTENALVSATDKELWAIFEKGMVADTVVQLGEKLVFYKSIRTAMPACLKCHGVPGTDIDSVTVQKIQTLYPSDLATSYKLNDFRGLWKIEFSAP